MNQERRQWLRMVGAGVPATLFAATTGAGPEPLPLVFRCAADNDLYRVLTAGGAPYPRFSDTARAVSAAPPGAGLLLLADGYPARTTPVDPALWKRAAAKRLRVYLEYPSALPGLPVKPPRRTRWERTVVASDAFGPALPRLRILAIHDCHFVPVPANHPDLVVARVAGFDTAVYGLPGRGVYPILFAHPRDGLLVATTKLSQFVTARYAPPEAWKTVWATILRWLCPGHAVAAPDWVPVVRPSFGRRERLPAEAEVAAFQKGVGWYTRAGMIVRPRRSPAQTRRCVDRARFTAYRPLRSSARPRDLGVFEGFHSLIRWDGSQPVSRVLRADCMGESAMAMAFSGALDPRAGGKAAAAAINNFIYFDSPIAQGPRADPRSPSYGLLGWNTDTRPPAGSKGPASVEVYYGDDNARALLGTMAAASLLSSERWSDAIARTLLANLRTTGQLGFRGSRLEDSALRAKGWRYFHDRRLTHYAPHYEAYLWACFLAAYHSTGFREFLERPRTALRMTMAAYPDRWHWTNGLQQERARMLLPLAWLVRVEDTVEHRGWLRRIAADALALQDGCGAIREQLGPAENGRYYPPKSNAGYGKREAPVIQENGDPACDLLYSTNFAFLGLHEAAAATGDPRYREAADKLASFLVRIQIRSSAHPELDGGWFRAFDYRQWDYWASNSDAGWGVWSIETGWTQAWITSVLALRQRGTSLWDLVTRLRLQRPMRHYQPLMLPDG